MIPYTKSITHDGKVMITCAGAARGLTIFDSMVKDNAMILNCTDEQFEEELAHYRGGAMMQSAFSFLNAEEREFLISGMLPSEFDSLRWG